MEFGILIECTYTLDVLVNCLVFFFKHNCCVSALTWWNTKSDDYGEGEGVIFRLDTICCHTSDVFSLHSKVPQKQCHALAVGMSNMEKRITFHPKHL